jgi:hypothetical protein
MMNIMLISFGEPQNYGRFLIVNYIHNKVFKNKINCQLYTQQSIRK